MIRILRFERRRYDIGISEMVKCWEWETKIEEAKSCRNGAWKLLDAQLTWSKTFILVFLLHFRLFFFLHTSKIDSHCPLLLLHFRLFFTSFSSLSFSSLKFDGLFNPFISPLSYRLGWEDLNLRLVEKYSCLTTLVTMNHINFWR